MSFFGQTMNRLKPVARGTGRALKAVGRALFRGAKGAGRILVKISKFVGRTVVKGSKCVGHTVVRITRVAVGKTGDALEMRRLKSRIKKGTTKAAAFKGDIGAYYWNKCESGAMSWDEEIDGVCRALRASEGDIAACEAQILNLQKKVYGPDGRVCVDDVEEFEEFEGDAGGDRREKREFEEYADENYTIEEYKDQGYGDQRYGDQRYGDQEYGDQGYVEKRYEAVNDKEKYGDEAEVEAEAEAVPSFIQFRNPSDIAGNHSQTPSDAQAASSSWTVRDLPSAGASPITTGFGSGDGSGFIDVGEEPVSVHNVKAYRERRKDNRDFWQGEEGLAETSAEGFISTPAEKPKGEGVSRYGKHEHEHEELRLEDLYEPYREKSLEGKDDVRGDSTVNEHREKIYCEFCGYANAPGVDVCERCGALVRHV